MKQKYVHALNAQKDHEKVESVDEAIQHIINESISGDLVLGDGDDYDTFSAIELAKRIRAGEDW
jgi:uncharacterized protein YggL (DUF469 family)